MHSSRVPILSKDSGRRRVNRDVWAEKEVGVQEIFPVSWRYHPPSFLSTEFAASWFLTRAGGLKCTSI